MSAEHAGAHAPTAGEYIQHHLQHLQMNFSFEGVKQTSIVDFSLFNLDSVVFALVAGFVVTMKVYWLAMALGWMQRKSTPN